MSAVAPASGNPAIATRLIGAGAGVRAAAGAVTPERAPVVYLLRDLI